MTTLAERNRNSTEDDYQSSEDTSETTRLFQERLNAWKHACDYLADYVSKTEKMQHAHAKEYEKVLKTVNSPLKEGDQFSQGLGGMNEMFDNLRTNTQSISNGHADTSKALHSSVLPIFTRLESEIKAKQKELKKGVGKGSKNVDKARSTTQKHVELLATHTASFDSPSARTKVDASNDPYIIQKAVNHRLNKQLSEENSTRSDMLGVQDNFSQFEAHVVKTFQQGIVAFTNCISQELDGQKRFYANMAQITGRQDPLHEWNGFIQRNNQILIDPSGRQRTLANATFPNQNHHSTQALCQGALERKQGLLKKLDTGFYAITPSKYMHEFKDDDDLKKDPSPEMSLYLPDCEVGGLNGSRFSVKGKDVTSKLGLGGAKEYEFHARSAEDAETWWRVIRAAVSDTEQGSTVSPQSSPRAQNRIVSGGLGSSTQDSAVEKDFAAENPASSGSGGLVSDAEKRL